MVQQAVARVGRTGWRQDEIAKLREAVTGATGRGEPLRGVFEYMGQTLGRKPNSIRNFYYAQLKDGNAADLPHALPFQTFSDLEVQRVRKVLEARAAGISVRACVMNLASGDKTQMLRYQNKYRSVLKNRPALVQNVMAEMAQEMAPAFDPYAPKVKERAQQSTPADPSMMQKMYEGIQRLLSHTDQRDPLVELDRMQVRQDLLRIELDDAKKTLENLRAICQPMVLTLKEYLGQPATARKNELPAFVKTMADYTSMLENALSMGS